VRLWHFSAIHCCSATALQFQVQALRLENPPYDFEAAFRNAKAGDAQVALILSSPFFIPPYGPHRGARHRAPLADDVHSEGLRSGRRADVVRRRFRADGWPDR